MRCKIPEDDLVNRLDNTFCLYSGAPVFVRCDGGGRLALYDSWKNTVHLMTIKSDDPLFDVSTPPLGYCNFADGEVVYVSRDPLRKYKQGFTRDVMKVTSFDGNYGAEVKLNSSAVQQMMSRQYPTLAKALKDIKKIRARYDEAFIPKGRYIDVAISNDCALREIGEEVQVWYRQEFVGVLQVALKGKPTVLVPSSRQGWLVSVYLRSFDWVVQ
jgi:hypothetical protein